MKILAALFFAFSLVLLSGCCTPACNPQQLIYIETTPECGAECFVSNDLGSWHIPHTPAMLPVYRSPSDLIIRVHQCGYVPTMVYVKARPTLGRITILRDFINRTCPGCEYPDSVHIPMRTAPMVEKGIRGARPVFNS